MAAIRKVAVIGASGNFGTPITTALRKAGFHVTIITRTQSTTQHPSDLPIIRADYTLELLTKALEGHDAAVCVVGPPGVEHQVTLIDAAEAAGVKRFIVDDFGWGPDTARLLQFEAIHAHRMTGWDHARARADANPSFTWTGISSGNPIDWALKKFSIMGFDVSNHIATLYDEGNKRFTGTTLEGIGQAVVGVLQHPGEAANRFIPVLSLRVSQNELLDAFQTATNITWETRHVMTETLRTNGEAKFKDGNAGWRLDLVAYQLFCRNEAFGNVALSREASGSKLLALVEESPLSVVEKVLSSI